MLAYKGLQKEKVALENSLKVLSPSSDSDLRRDKLREKGRRPSTEQIRGLRDSFANEDERTAAYDSGGSPLKGGGGQCLEDNSGTQHQKVT